MTYEEKKRREKIGCRNFVLLYAFDKRVERE